MCPEKRNSGITMNLITRANCPLSSLIDAEYAISGRPKDSPARVATTITAQPQPEGEAPNNATAAK